MKEEPPPDIVGMGICTVDYLLSVPQMPVYGGAIKARQFLRQSGGLTASALVAAARLGARTRIIARIGDDEEGQFIRRDLESEGVDTSGLRIEPGTQSHLTVVLVDANTGERSFISRWATGSTIAPDEIQREDITAARILFVDNVNSGTLQAAQWAREAGMTVVLDPACSYAVAQAILPLVDVPIVSERFATEWMPDAPPAQAAAVLYEAGAKIAVVTLGERGCVVCTTDGLHAYPALPVPVVDTTGAGDAFHGAFMVGLVQGWDVPRIVRFASAVGALNCRFLGGRTGLPTRAEVDQFLAQPPGDAKTG
jgi:sulfofructose kinase